MVTISEPHAHTSEDEKEGSCRGCSVNISLLLVDLYEKAKIRHTYGRVTPHVYSEECVRK